MSERKKRSAAEQAAKTSREASGLFVALVGGGGVVLFLAWLAYSWRVGIHGDTATQAGWGQLGDFIGGVTNPVLSFAALVALAWTVKLQADQLNAAREELDAARESQEKAEQGQLEQLAATRDLAQAQARTAEAQERAALMLGQQLDDARAAQVESTARLVEQLQAARDLVDAQLVVAAAMERAAGAQELSAVSIRDQLTLGKATAASQRDAANAQLAAAVFAVAAEVQRAGGAGNGPDVTAMFSSKPDLVTLLMRSVRTSLSADMAKDDHLKHTAAEVDQAGTGG